MVFEVLVEREGRWVLNGICDRQSEAVQIAQSLLVSKQYSAAKVVEIADSGRERTVFEQDNPIAEGEQPLTISTNFDNETVFVCERLDDIYDRPARVALNRLLRAYLDRECLTVCELQHSFGHLKRVAQNEGFMTQAMSVLAQAQVRGTATKIPDRLDVLYELYREASDRARRMSVNRNLPEIRPGQLKAAIGKVDAAAEANDRDFWVRSAITMYVGQARDWVNKMALVLDITGRDPTQDVLDQVDPFIGDILASGLALRELLGRHDNLGDVLIDLAKLCRGAIEKDRQLPEATARLNELFASTTDLAESRATLTDRITRELKSNKPLFKNNPERERKLVAQLRALLTDADGRPLGGVGVLEALEDRSGRQIVPTLKEILKRFKTASDRIEQLLQLESSAVGRMAKAAIAKYLVNLVSHYANLEELAGRDKPALEQVRRLAFVQRRIEQSGLPRDAIETIGLKLDLLGHRLLTMGHVLEGLARAEKSDVRRAIKVLNLLKEGAFTEPEAGGHARQMALSLTRRKGFLEALAAELGQGKDVERLLREFERLCRDAGVTGATIAA